MHGYPGPGIKQIAFFMNYLQMKKIFLLIFLSFSFLNIAYPQINYNQIDSLKVLLNKSGDKQKLAVLDELIYNHYFYVSIDTAKIYSQMAIDLSRKINSKSYEAKFLKYLARCYYLMTDYEKSIGYLFKARKIYEDIKDTTGIIHIYYAVADIYQSNGQFDLSYDQVKKGIKLAEKTNNEERVAAFSSLLGLIYKSRDKDYKKAIEYFKKALSYYSSINDETEMAVSYMNLANTYSQMNDINNVIKYLNEGLKYAKKYNMSRLIVFGLMQKAQNLMNLNKNNEANKILKEILNYRQEQFQEVRSQAYLMLSEIATSQKKFKEAYEYLSSYNYLLDTLNTRNRKDKIATVESKYLAQKKQAEIDLLSKDNKIASLTRNLFIVGFIFVFIIAGGLFNRYRYKDKTNKKLTVYSNQLSLMNNKLESELEQAASYILSLLPQKLDDKIKTDWIFIPSAHLGGDSFGYEWLDNNHFAFYLIDVSGHGVGASLLTTTILNIIKTKSLSEANFKNPASVLNSLNKAFDSEKHEGKYFSLWYGVINVQKNKLVCSSGFHPPALIKSQETISELGTKDMMLGMFKDYEYGNLTYNLKNGDRIYLFSDGCFELETTKGQSLDFYEFTKIISQQSGTGTNSLNKIYHSLTSLHGSKSFNDDYSMIEITV